MTFARFVRSRRAFAANRTARRILLAAALPLLLALDPRNLLGQTTLPAFRDKPVFTGLSSPTAIAFSPDGRVFVAEKRGTVKVFSNLSDTTATVFADLRVKVYNNWDRGLLGLALHPNFPTTPYVYVMYTYDAAIGGTAPRWGPGDGNSDPCPDPPGSTGDGCVVSGRISRLQASGDVMVGQEQVLVEDWFQQYPSHSIGSIVFGPDGALYATGGDGASFNFSDYGQDGNPLNPGGDPPVPVGGVQTPPTAEGGALRSQDLRTKTGTDPVTLDGTLIRIDPETGAALPDNPLFANPDPNAKRVLAYGLRNPFRMTFRPGTSEIWVGDVGWSTWEEINRYQATPGARNFGWPCYEGVGRMSSYDNLNLNICENLYAEAGAVTAPYYTYNHNARIVPFETCPTGSSSITGLAFYTGGSYPGEYQGALFFSDYSRGCIWAMMPGSGGNPNPSNIRTFVAGAPGPVQLTTGPGGDLFYPDIGGTIRRIQYDVPVAAISADPSTGRAPLEVHFSGAGSTHPNPLETLSYSWDLNGDGVFGDATTVQTSSTFTAVGSHTVTLKVSDTHGGVDTESVVISVDNAPPVPAISAPLPTLTWKVDDIIDFAGSATDPQDGSLPPSALTWSLLLHHCPSNCHTHPLTVLGSSFQAPDHEYPSHLELKLTARDSAGLEASTSVLLYPQAVALNFATSPTGLQLSHNTTSGPAPFSNTVIIGSQNSVSAPSPQLLGGNTYEFLSWSDGSTASHNFTAPALPPPSYTATFVLQPPPSSLSASPSAVAGGNPSTGAVVLSGPAPPSGAVVALTSSSPAVAGLPSSVTVASGATSANFPISTAAVATDTPVTLTGFYGGGNAATVLTVTHASNAPPSVAITSPLPDATFGEPASITIDASASDADGTVVRVDFYWGTTLLGSDDSLPYSFVWNNVPAGSYGLTAAAVDDRAGTTTSAAVPITVNGAGSPPPPWGHQDVGAVGLQGSASYLNGSHTVVGSGANIAGTADAFHFVSQAMSGDGEIVARITGVQNTTANSKGGIMIRESLAANSSNVAMILTGGNRFQFQRRASTGGTTSVLSGTQTPPHWVKLVRSGNTFTAYRSSNGVTWTQYATPVTVPMSANVYVGLVMSSNNNSVLGTATLDGVNVVSGPPNASPSATVTSPVDGASFTDPTSISIEAAASDGDGSVSRVDFFAGTTLLGSDSSEPFSYAWDAPPAGSRSLTARAVDNLGAAATSSPVTISVSYTPTSQLPAPWTNQDVGAVGVAGTATHAAGVFQVTGSGANIAGTADGFHFVFQPMSGDGTIMARITGVQNTTVNSKGGIMIRESLAAGSANVAMILTGGNRFQFQVRGSTGGTTSNWTGTQAPPHWVKLVRSGNTFTAYRSSNGVAWTLYGASPVTVPMSANVYVGLVMTSNSNSVPGTATLDNVSKSP